MGTDRALKDGPPTLYLSTLMTRDLALSLLRTGNDGNQILQILETLTDDVEQENIADFLEHAATLQEVQF